MILAAGLLFLNLGGCEVERRKSDAELGLNLSYTIYLNLPKTDDISVFNAIFKSLKENFFRR